jgi:hypothetical protein
MKKVIILLAVGIAVFLMYRWANPPPSPYAGFPQGFQREMERIDIKVREDSEGDLGQGAVALCRARLGIKERVQTGMDLVNRGYGANKAMEFSQCVVDLMYPVPNK